MGMIITHNSSHTSECMLYVPAHSLASDPAQLLHLAHQTNEREQDTAIDKSRSTGVSPDTRPVYKTFVIITVGNLV